MKYKNDFYNTLKNSTSIKPIIKKITPKKLIEITRNYSNKDTSVSVFFENTQARFDFKSKESQGFMPVYYWDSKLNFGDLVGPYLVSKITAKPILNIKNLKSPGVMAVGSIIQMLDRKDMVIWGSGLMHKPTTEQAKNLRMYNPKVLSVRGSKTAECLLKIGIEISNQDAYGDPALILPLFYKPLISETKEIGICPHYKHKADFSKNNVYKKGLKIIDVQNDMESVVDLIASSKVCISTSLHGLIIAQAYNIPWVWLEIYDDNLYGNDFKFRDFFSTIDQTQVSHVRVKSKDIDNIDYHDIAKKASLPKKRYSEELILECLNNYLNNSNASN
ncbi:hypothetical protein AOT82_2607 [Psychrobacter sp. AntiMn-1]|uniref:polysaccharide pyruvyl transferase family protein n=1 Tax=Psychrobacter sp. AntiMn-1 TaxID=1720344 RepID=UPI0008A6E0D1|nr:polysaccharide pyruvyl transferase family protein [Psychrobacter sp. AntiMn-1]AOY44986.1 hypothetical protein AOT82_2607 [Psychrobacter sp. AntiMn-1]